MLGDNNYPMKPVVLDRETCFFLPAEFLSLYGDPVMALSEFMYVDIFEFQSGKYLPQSESFNAVLSFARNYLRQDEEKLEKLYFHNECHTFHPVKGVLAVTLKLAIVDGFRLTDTAYERIALAAVLHDIGNIIARREHEQISIDVSRAKLFQLGYSEDMINGIACNIYSTAIDYSDGDAKRMVSSREAKLLSDADLSNPGFYDVTNCAFESIKIWLELDLFDIQQFETEGVKFTQQFFNNLGDYYTGVARYLFSKRRTQNLANLGKEIKRILHEANYQQARLLEMIHESDQQVANIKTNASG